MTEDDGRLYKIARRNAPLALGTRTCPNCHREKDIDHFRKVKRGAKGWSWICKTCYGNRRPPRQV